MRRLALAALLLGACSEPKPPPRLESLSTPEGHPRSKIVSRGETFSPVDYLVPGHVTVLGFSADWCKISQQASPWVDQLVARYDKVLLRKVDVGDGVTPAARQAKSEHQLKSTPFYVVFDGRGLLVGRVEGPDVGALEWGIRKALAP